jgi:hypothetical protein
VDFTKALLLIDSVTLQRINLKKVKYAKFFEDSRIVQYINKYALTLLVNLTHISACGEHVELSIFGGCHPTQQRDAKFHVSTGHKKSRAVCQTARPGCR